MAINRTAAARVLVPTFLSCAIQVPGGRRRGTARSRNKLESKSPCERRGRWLSPTTSAGTRASLVTAPHKWVRTPTRALRIRLRRRAADKSLPSSTSKSPPRRFPLSDGASRRWHQWRALLSSADVRGLGLKSAVVSVIDSNQRTKASLNNEGSGFLRLICCFWKERRCGSIRGFLSPPKYPPTRPVVLLSGRICFPIPSSVMVLQETSDIWVCEGLKRTQENTSVGMITGLPAG